MLGIEKALLAVVIQLRLEVDWGLRLEAATTAATTAVTTAVTTVQRVLEQDRMAGLGAGGEQAEGVDDFHADAVGHSDELRSGGRIEVGHGGLIARVEFQDAGLFENHLGFEIAHGRDFVAEGVPTVLGGEHAQRVVAAKLVTHHGDDGALAPLVGEWIVGAAVELPVRKITGVGLDDLVPVDVNGGGIIG